MKLKDIIHESYVKGRRARILASHLAKLIPPNASVLDVGCGDGLIAWTIMQIRTDVVFQGIDVIERSESKIHVEIFDGQFIPKENESFDVVMLVDVLHHAKDPHNLMAEVFRVSRKNVLIKDHLLKGFLAGPTLRFMDRVGNLRYKVALPYNYWPQERWHRELKEMGAKIIYWNTNLGLYPWPASWIFERSLHFIALLEKGPFVEN